MPAVEPAATRSPDLAESTPNSLRMSGMAGVTRVLLSIPVSVTVNMKTSGGRRGTRRVRVGPVGAADPSFSPIGAGQPLPSEQDRWTLSRHHNTPPG